MLQLFVVASLSYCFNENINSGRSYYVIADNVEVFGCFFERSSTFSNNGSVICLSGLGCSLSVTECVFNSCKIASGTNLFGGAIYFQSMDCKISKTCALDCNAGEYRGHFAYLNTYNNKNNTILFLSMSKCSNTGQGYYPIRVSRGIQTYDNSNTSNNKAYWGSGFLSENADKINSMYSSFYQNEASNLISLQFYNSTGTVGSSNIIRNSSPNGYGVIYINSKGDILFHQSIILSNSGSLVYLNPGKLSFLFCYIQHVSLATTYMQSCVYHSSIVTSTYNLEHFSTFLCYTPPIITSFVSHNSKSRWVSINIFVFSSVINI